MQIQGLSGCHWHVVQLGVISTVARSLGTNLSCINMWSHCCPQSRPVEAGIPDTDLCLAETRLTEFLNHVNGVARGDFRFDIIFLKAASRGWLGVISRLTVISEQFQD